LVKSNSWHKRNQLLGEGLINIITPFGVKKMKNGIKKKSAKTKGPESSAC